MLTLIWSATDTIFCHFRPFFALLPHYWPRKLKFGKNVKNTWRYCPLTLLYDKWQSYDVWFLRYQARQKEFFVILGYFLPFYPSNSWKNENFKKNKKKRKKHLEISSLYKSVPKLKIICYTVPEMWCVTDVIIFHFGLFFVVLPH